VLSAISTVSSLTAGTAAGIRTPIDYRHQQPPARNNYIKKINAVNISNDRIMEIDSDMRSNNDMQPLPLQDPTTMQQLPMITPNFSVPGQQAYLAGGMKRSRSDPSLGSLLREEMRAVCDDVTLEDDVTLGSGLSKIWDSSSYKSSNTPKQSNFSLLLHQTNRDNFGDTSVYSAMSISQISTGLGNMSINSVENNSMAEYSGIFSNNLNALDLASIIDD